MKGSRRSGITFPASRVCLLWRSKESTLIAITDGISLDSPFVSKRVVAVRPTLAWSSVIACCQVEEIGFCDLFSLSNFSLRPV